MVSSPYDSQLFLKHWVSEPHHDLHLSASARISPRHTMKVSLAVHAHLALLLIFRHLGL